jgi:hypothetical protein
MVAVPASLAGGGEEAAAAVSAALRTAMRPFENTNANAPADSDMYAPPHRSRLPSPRHVTRALALPDPTSP